MIAQHNFRDSLELSHRIASAPWWETVYRQAFPDLSEMSALVDNLDQQRKGIDRILTLTGGKQLYIDEKVRANTWTDVLLEKWSSWEDKTPGWIEKPLHCDYIAYAFMSAQVCYLFPFQNLRHAWAKHEREWTQRFGVIRANNKTYTTVCVPVPLGYLMLADCAPIWTFWGNAPQHDDDLPW